MCRCGREVWCGCVLRICAKHEYLCKCMRLVYTLCDVISYVVPVIVLLVNTCCCHLEAILSDTFWTAFDFYKANHIMCTLNCTNIL